MGQADMTVKTWADMTVYDKDFPEPRLVVEVTSAVSSPPEEDMVVKMMTRLMWGSRCHYGLVFTPASTFVLRDTFETLGPDSIHVTDVLPTDKVLGRVGRLGANGSSVRDLELLAHKWLVRLATRYEAALPDDPEVTNAFFPGLVGAVVDGRVVPEERDG